ncbi:MAG TPA: lmo0937 family membrane protein [Candidatus Aquicultor sp.]
MASFIWFLIAILVIFWVVGFALKIAGGLINLLLVVALILLIYNLLVNTRRRQREK